MSISASLGSFEWDGRRINLLDTPGEPSFVADALGSLRVCESAIFVVNAVMGVVFGWLYARTRRVMPLVVAHTLLDVIAFVGYALLRERLTWL